MLLVAETVPQSQSALFWFLGTTAAPNAIINWALLLQSAALVILCLSLPRCHQLGFRHRYSDENTNPRS